MCAFTLAELKERMLALIPNKNIVKLPYTPEPNWLSIQTPERLSTAISDSLHKEEVNGRKTCRKGYRHHRGLAGKL